MNHLTKTKKKKVHAEMNKIKRTQSSRNFVKIHDSSNKMSRIKHNFVKQKNFNKNNTQRIKINSPSYGGLSSRLLSDYEQEIRGYF